VVRKGLARKSGDLRQYARMTIAPEKMPPEPRPAIARPTIRALLLGAVAQTRELGFIRVCCWFWGRD
jgi:hypothetical protein